MLTLHYMGSREFPFFQNDQFNFFYGWLYFLLYFLLGWGRLFFFIWWVIGKWVLSIWWVMGQYLLFFYGWLVNFKGASLPPHVFISGTALRSIHCTTKKHFLNKYVYLHFSKGWKVCILQSMVLLPVHVPVYF